MNERIVTGIPTTYRGIKFRSRTEATWAVLFDRVGWLWDYEPFDLQNYIPDFALRFKRETICEIKGAFAVDELDQHHPKIEQSGWHGEVLLLACAPLEDGHPHPVVGQLGEQLANGEWLWSPARAFSCIACGTVSVLAEDNSWDCRLCGVPAQGNLGAIERDPDGAFKEWALAKNRMQWRPGT